MPDKITLTVVGGKEKGKAVTFKDHDTFVFGRMEDCQVCLPEDTFISRHHFILEALPPQARLRDLGSLNGTWVNGVKYGGREKHETPTQAALKEYPEVELKDGDEIKVGETVMDLAVERALRCVSCGNEIPDEQVEKRAQPGGTYMCADCQADLEKRRKEEEKKKAEDRKPVQIKKPKPVICQKCGKDVTAEVNGVPQEGYICQNCQKEPELDLAAALVELFEKLKIEQSLPPEAQEINVPDYEIIRELGRGGMGAVYLTKHKKTGQQVALKVMLSKVAVKKSAREQFMREIESQRTLKHKNIVGFVGQGSVGNMFYFLQEFCSGGCVGKLMVRSGGRLNLKEVGPIMLDSLEGMGFAHSSNYVHRDLKPQNILLQNADGKQIAKIGDFGMAKNFTTAGLSGMTVTGQYGGTPPFMPREQVINFRYVEPVTDVWALGATFYNMLTGNFPLDFSAAPDPVAVILNKKPVAIRHRRSDIPARVAEVIDRALEVKVTDRYKDAGEMLAAMRKVL